MHFLFKVASDSLIDNFRSNVAELDEKLKQNKTGFLVGGQLTLADISAAMVLDFLETVPGLVAYRVFEQTWKTRPLIFNTLHFKRFFMKKIQAVFMTAHLENVK